MHEGRRYCIPAISEEGDHLAAFGNFAEVTAQRLGSNIETAACNIGGHDVLAGLKIPSEEIASQLVCYVGKSIGNISIISSLK